MIAVNFTSTRHFGQLTSTTKYGALPSESPPCTSSVTAREAETKDTCKDKNLIQNLLVAQGFQASLSVSFSAHSVDWHLNSVTCSFLFYLFFPYGICSVQLTMHNLVLASVLSCLVLSYSVPPPDTGCRESPRGDSQIVWVYICP
jgi:hypothetical protein